MTQRRNRVGRQKPHLARVNGHWNVTVDGHTAGSYLLLEDALDVALWVGPPS